MNKRLLHSVFPFLLVAGSLATAADPEPKQRSGRPLRALLVTGGCCHDYDRQKLIIPRGVSARADVVWTVVQQGGKSTNAQIPLYDDPNWADGFDIVVHNECFANARDVEWVERVLKPHREGLPAVLIHCAMHCYRTGDDRWFEFVGLQSPGHGPHYSYVVENLEPKHPIMAGFGEQWTAPKGELYHSVKLFPNCKPLGHAKRRGDNKPQVCVWTNQYGKARVFATTIGHYNETMAEPKYLNMLTRGMLWAADRLGEGAFRETDEKTDDRIRSLVAAPVNKPAAQATTKCCGEGNLAFGGPTQASTEESAKKNFARNAVDGDLNTRWCAANGNANETWQVDLGKPDHVKSLRIHWEKGDAAYQYRVDASADGKSWRGVVDASDNKKVQQITSHEVDAPNTRFLRVQFLNAQPRYWASFWEFEAYAGKLPPLPPGVAERSSGKPTVTDVQSPAGFRVTTFAAPPEVTYPVCIAAGLDGEVFVGVDEQGSLGKKKGHGRVLRCLDVDGDGVADRINVFAKMDHPRGLFYDNGSLWVLHPPNLTVFHDEDRDGAADRYETLLTGVTTDQLRKRGADHTTNGIRVGIDGWIYIAVGDFGMLNCRGVDGRTIRKRGGGVVRVRPDGREMEVYAWGLRNILDVCIDPYMNMFTRDNTNDGGGWDIRLSHVLQSADYGYPSKYMRFSGETMPPLAQYGGGSGCGGMFAHDARWPVEFGDALYTCDWGRSEVYRHRLPKQGPTFAADQDVFLKIPRPTDIDMDAAGRMYVSSWKNGKFDFSGNNVGFVAQITPLDYTPHPAPRLAELGGLELVDQLSSPSAAVRLCAQRAILRQVKTTAGVTDRLVALASDDDAEPAARVAAIYTLKQRLGADSHDALQRLASQPVVREHVLRALTDRIGDLDKAPPVNWFAQFLQDPDPRVRAQAIISLGRIGDRAAAPALLPLTARSDKPLKHHQPDADRVIPHLVTRALIALESTDACAKALAGPHRAGALAALQELHEEESVRAVIASLNGERDDRRRRELVAALVRLYHREGEYDGGWWGTRPDTSGPYYDRKTWAQSAKIAQVIRTAAGDADSETAKWIGDQLVFFKVKIDGVDVAKKKPVAETQKPITIVKADPNDPNAIAQLAPTDVLARAMKRAGDAGRGKELFTRQACVACHTFADGQTPKGPHLVDIGKRYKPAELLESILKPAAKIAQGFETYSFATVDGLVETGFVVRETAEAIHIRRATGVLVVLPRDDVEERVKQSISMMPDGLVDNVTPEQLADLLAYLQSLGGS